MIRKVLPTMFHKTIHSIKKNSILVLIMLFAFGIRFYGVFPGFHAFHPDEHTSYSTARYMLYHRLEPGRVDYPAGMPLLNLLVYVNFFIPLSVAKLIFSQPAFFTKLMELGTNASALYDEDIFGPRAINALYWSRYISAFIGGSTILLTYFTAKKLFNKEVGLIAAFFLCFNYRHVLASYFALPDIYNSFFGILSLFAAVLLLEKNTMKRYILAGITVGFFLSIKYLFFALGPFLFAHVYWMYKKNDLKYLFHRNFIYSLIVICLVFLLINPYLFSDINAFIKRTEYTMFRYGIGKISFRPYPYFYLFYWGIGQLPSVAIVFGGILMIVRSIKNFLLISSFVFPLFFVMTIWSEGGIFLRNFIPVMPFLMIFAGFFVYQIYILLRRMPIGKYAWFFVVVILISINLSSITNSFTLSYWYAKPWNSTILIKWLKTKMPQDVTVRHYSLYLLPQLERQALGEKKIILKSWDTFKGPNSLAEFQEENTDFAVLNTQDFQDAIYLWRTWGETERFLQYNTVPYDFIESSFNGLAVKELLQYTVYETYKPWQAHLNSNFLVFKIPTKPKDLGKRIAYFGFDIMENTWKIQVPYGDKPLKIEWDGDYGKEEKGAIKIEPISQLSGGTTLSRISSPPISITEGKLYTARAFILNSPKGSIEESDGFLRLDFYNEKNEQHLEKVGEFVSISRRAPVSEEWEEVQTILQAPKDARYVTVSFQRKDLSAFTSYIDDIELFETSLVPQESYKEVPYINPTIPLESIYYNSFL